VIKATHIFFILAFVIISFSRLFALPPTNDAKNILLINSYHQNFGWTDSLTSGISKELKSHKNITLYIEYLNSKQFGQSQFEITKQYFKEKYAKVPFAGVLVTDNDALDFAIQTENDLFPNIPKVFAGISNPEDYQLEGSNFRGYKETTNTDSIVDLIRQLLPETKRLLVITDKTTTGKIYRQNFIKNQSKNPKPEIEFTEEITIEAICNKVQFNTNFDAIFYIGVSQDDEGKIVDSGLLLIKIGQLTNVPLFSNDRLYIGKGIVGGLSQSGAKQGTSSAKLLMQLVNSSNTDAFARVYSQNLESFFDYKLLRKYGISTKYLPHGAIIANKGTLFSKRNFEILLFILALSTLIIIFLFINNQRRKAEQKRSNSQLIEIETQKNKLEITSKKLETVIAELEDTNNKLNETNAKLLQAKKKAEESDKLKSAFLANVSHEIRTPLNSIVGFSSLLAEVDLSEEKRNFYNSIIESNSESLLVLIDEIIDLSKIEAQQLNLYKQTFSIDLLLDELYQIMVNNHRNSKVELRIARISKEKELFVYSDRVRVKQIFINLLTNAYKFTYHSFIEMGYYETENHQIELYVKDSGIGIAEEYHQAIFERFLKVESDQKKIHRGTGLGLAITKKLVELLGGKIGIDSKVGIGTVFFFSLSNLELLDKSNQ
jgi:signal transduction histidine kinase